jgi:hypothetical protein
MIPLLALLLPLPFVCHSWQQEPAAPPEHARWIEAEGVQAAAWMGWADGGPRRAAAPTRGPWLAIEFELPPTPPDPAGWTLDLADGARLRGGPGPDRPDLGLPTWRLSGADGPVVPLDLIWLRRQSRTTLPPRPDGEEDALWLRRQGGVLDQQRGFLLDWSAAGLRFEGPAGERQHPWEEVEGFALLDEPVEPQRDAAWLFLADGGTLSARILRQDPRAEGGDYEVEFAWGARSRIPARWVTRIRRRSGVEEWSRVEWQVAEQPAAQALDWSPKVDRSVEGRVLRLGARTYPQGIGVHAPCEIMRRVPGPGFFFATVGADGATAAFRQPQPVVFRVLLDDEQLVATAPLAAAGEPQPLLLRVPRAGLLRLRAEPAAAPQRGAHANWCDLLWLPGE